jgi:hypothetical protein
MTCSRAPGAPWRDSFIKARGEIDPTRCFRSATLAAEWHRTVLRRSSPGVRRRRPRPSSGCGSTPAPTAALAVGNDDLRGGPTAGDRFKARTFAIGRRPAATFTHRLDLRHNWTRELLLAGFDAGSPTARIAESPATCREPDIVRRDHPTVRRDRIATDQPTGVEQRRVRAIAASQRAMGWISTTRRS